jgi:hypothetical protein
MTTLREWFDQFTTETGEQVEVVLVGDELTTYATARSTEIDRVFDDGYGLAECPPFCAWSPSWVLFPAQYDGAEWLSRVPRNPIVHEPVQPGSS